jgi:hypothetical protein
VKRSLLAAGLLLAARAALVGAQVVDTTRADSLARDTTDYTAQFLKAQQDARLLVPVAPRIGAGELLPFRTRFVFDRDSILWHNAETVSDLLSKVPGVFILRGGWTGRPELPTFQARGATSVDYVLDGVPYLPIGQDSVMVDPSLLPMSFLSRVEIERLPGHLRVYLFTHHHDRVVPYSRIGIASGDLQISRYQGTLEKRSSKGFGFAAAFDHLSVPAQPGVSGDYSNTQGRLRLDYVPSARFAAEIQYLLSSPDREAVFPEEPPSDTLSQARHGSRKDLSARIFLARRADGLGPRLDLIASRTSWVDEIEKDSTRTIINQLEFNGVLVKAETVFVTSRHRRGVTQLGALLGYRLPAASLQGSLFYRSSWTPLDLQARGGIAPSRWLTASLEGVYRRHDGGRSSEWLAARAGIILPMGFSASGVWRRGSEVALPSITADQAQDLDDRSLMASWQGGFAEVEASYSSTAGYRPTSFAQYPHLASIGPSGRTNWITVNARIAPRQWLVLDGWYSTPQGTRPEGQPPTQSVINGTIQSKFLPTFKSGIFNVKLQFSMENWGTGVLARDKLGNPITLKGATHIRSYIGLQIGAFMAYYNRYNVLGTGLPYVPDSNPAGAGLGPPGFASTFGVRWEFSN